MKDYSKLTKILEEVYDKDQESREDYKKQRKIDEENLKIVEDILDKYGWLSSDQVGDKASYALFLVIQHANLDIKLKYYDLIKKSVDKIDFAFFEDRVLLEEGKKQLYGTQLKYIDDKYELEEIEDIDNLDKRRKEVGLEPIKEYLKKFNK